MAVAVDLNEYKAQQAARLHHAHIQWDDELKGRVVVITGGSRGIGMAMARALLAAGANVAATDKSFKGSEDFATALEDSGRGQAIVMDVTSSDELDAGYEAVLSRFGTVDVLINNAALVSETLFAPRGHVKTLDTSDEDWAAMFDVNVFGALKAIRRFIRPMLEKQSGSIINLVSSGILTSSNGGGYMGYRPWSVEMPYQASKAALMTLSFYLADEVRADGVAVNAMMPGHTRASWFDATARAFSAHEETYATRPVVPEHIVPITLFLSAQNGRGVSGRLYNVPEWNYDHGFGNYALWLDRWLPEDIEAAYRRLEAATPANTPPPTRRPV